MNLWDVSPEKSARQSEYLDAVMQGNTASFPADPPMAQILPRVLPLVRDAMNKFEEYGMPLFHRVAEAHGIAMDDRPRKETSIG